MTPSTIAVLLRSDDGGRTSACCTAPVDAYGSGQESARDASGTDVLSGGMADGHHLATFDTEALGIGVRDHDDRGALVHERLGPLDGDATKQRSRCD